MCPYLTGSTGYPPWWSGLTAAVPVCVGVRAMGGPWGVGGLPRQGHTFCRSPAGRGWRVWGVVCARCSGPQQRGMGALPEAAEGVGRVTCSFLPPTTEPQKGAQGVWSEVLLD